MKTNSPKVGTDAWKRLGGMTLDEAELRLRIGNTPTCEYCDESLDHLHCSPMHAIDSDDCLRSLLGFLTLRPGDTDEDYFANYTPEQMEFAQGDAENLQEWGMEPDSEFTTPEFTYS